MSFTDFSGLNVPVTQWPAKISGIQTSNNRPPPRLSISNIIGQKTIWTPLLLFLRSWKIIIMRPFLETSCLNTTKKVTKLTNCILSLKEVTGSAQKSGKKINYSRSLSFKGLCFYETRQKKIFRLLGGKIEFEFWPLRQCLAVWTIQI